MERDFRYLRDKYGDAGARDIFEKYVSNYFRKNLKMRMQFKHRQVMMVLMFW